MNLWLKGPVMKVLCSHSDMLRLAFTKTLTCCPVPYMQKVTISNKETSHAKPVNLNTIKRRPRSRLPFINWLYDDLLKGTLKINAFYLYAEVTNQVNYFHFFKIFNMDDTFNSWFLITELHVWMLLVRLKAAGKDGKTVSGSLVAALWDDTTSRAKALSPGDSSTSKKQIQILSQEFKASLLLYDEGLLGTDTLLASALWFRLLSQSCDDPRLLELLTAYVRSQIHYLDNVSLEDILLHLKVKWKSLPEPSALKYSS